VGADIVEVSPPYDTAEVTAVAASHAAYELLALFASSAGGQPRPSTPAA
jgi:agmatinase